MSKRLYSLNQQFINIDYNKIPKSNVKLNKTTLDAINGPFYRIR